MEVEPSKKPGTQWAERETQTVDTRAEMESLLQCARAKRQKKPSMSDCRTAGGPGQS